MQCLHSQKQSLFSVLFCTLCLSYKPLKTDNSMKNSVTFKELEMNLEKYFSHRKTLQNNKMGLMDSVLMINFAVIDGNSSSSGLCQRNKAA